MPIADHSVTCMLSVLCLFVALVVSHFGFEGRTLVLIASVPGYSGLENIFGTYSSCGASGLNFSLVLTPVALVLN